MISHNFSFLLCTHSKGTDVQVPRFDKQLEEFYSVCDQIELNLQAIINCCTQSTSSQKYVPPTVSQVRQEPTSMSSADVLTYTNYINITRNQVSYIKDVMDALNGTACKYVNSNASIYCYLFENVS